MIVFDQVWTIVQAGANRPFVAPAATVLAFVVARRAQGRWPNNPLLNPTLCAILLVIAFIEVNDIPYANYIANTQVISFMLGPTIVLLAVPLYRRLPLIRASWPLVIVALIVGLPIGILSSIAIGLLFGANPETIYALAPKSVTAGIAMGIEDGLGGIPALSAVFVISTGIFGAAFGPWILRILRIRDQRVLGMAIGIGAHGIGTARAFQLSEKAGAFASLAMALNGVATAIVIPVVASAMHLHVGAPVVAREGSPLPAPPGDSMRAQIETWGSDLWTFLIANQSELLVSVSILVAFTSFAALYLMASMMRKSQSIEERMSADSDARETIAALERLAGRQALELERVTSRPPQSDLADAIPLSQKTVPFRRPVA